MNRNITLAFFFLILSAGIACAQTDTLRIYYDADWAEISSPKKAAYYRIAYPGDSGQWHVRDFYKAGQLQMSGTFLNRAMQPKSRGYKLHAFFRTFIHFEQIKNYLSKYIFKDAIGNYYWFRYRRHCYCTAFAGCRR